MRFIMLIIATLKILQHHYDGSKRASITMHNQYKCIEYVYNFECLFYKQFMRKFLLKYIMPFSWNIIGFIFIQALYTLRVLGCFQPLVYEYTTCTSTMGAVYFLLKLSQDIMHYITAQLQIKTTYII